MTCRWWGININCVKCEVECLITGAFFSADGEIMFLANCPKCKNIIKWTVMSTRLSYLALRNDMEAEVIAKAVKTEIARIEPLRPPIAPKLSDDDIRWCSELHIDTEGGTLQ